jgi:transcriptional regulator with XRE-family HTH domain
LRKARELPQVQLAQALETSQSEVSKIERRADLCVSTLRSYIEAMGGQPELLARFPDDAVRINQLRDLEESENRTQG